MNPSPPSENNEKKSRDTSQQTPDLARLRKKAGLSLEDMANRLKLGQELLQQLEAGETEHLGATAYIKGYLKNYAKILGIPAAELIAQYPLPEDKLPRINTQYAIANVAPRRRSSGHFLGYLLGTLVVAAFAYGIWYMMTQNRSSHANGLSVQVGSSGSKDQAPDTSGENDFHYSSLLPPPPAGQSSQESLTESQNPEENPPTSSKDKATDDLPEQKEAPDNGTASLEGNPAGPADQEMGGSGQLTSIQLELSEPAWVSIQQTNGSRLEHNLLAAGSYQYQASLPLHFRLGNAQNVRVQINGANVSFTDKVSKDVADFDWPDTGQKLATN